MKKIYVEQGFLSIKSSFTPTKNNSAFRIFFLLLLITCTSASVKIVAQNTLNNAGLSASSTAAGAFSLRKLSSSYAGAAVQVRRSSDNSLQNIGFNGSGDLDQVALLTFTGSGSGYVSIWYDQSGYGRDAVQTSASSQPRIVNTGVVELQNGKPTLVFSGAQSMNTPLTGIDATAANGSTTANLVFKADTRASVLLSNCDGGTRNYNVHAPWADGNTYFDVGDIGGSGRMNQQLTWIDYSIGTFVKSNTSGTVYRNGVTAFSKNSFSGTVTSSNSMWIGSFTNTNLFMVGSLAEAIIFPLAISDLERSTLEANQNTYYTVTPTSIPNTISAAGLTSSTPAAAMYSLRKMSSTYTGYAIQVRRSSDNALYDIGFTPSGDLDTSALTLITGAGSAYVATWYDQSGFGRNAAQSTAANQPRIMNAGVVERKNGKPALVFSGSQTMLTSLSGADASAAGNLTTANFVFNNATANSSLFSNGSYVSNRYNIHAPWGDGTTYFDNGDILSGGRIFGNLTWTDFSVGTFRRNNTQGNVWKNGASSISASFSTNITSPEKIWIGSTDGSSNFITGALSEITIFPSAISDADRQTLECNQDNYYAVTGTLAKDFVIQSTPSATGCYSMDEQVVWNTADLYYVYATGSNLLKRSDIKSINNVWNGGAASVNRLYNNGYFTFTATETNRTRIAGLSSSNLSPGNTDIQYAFQLNSDASFNVYESGALRGSFGTYSSGDVFKIWVEANVVKYYRNGALIYSSGVTPTLPLLADVSIYSNGGTVTNAIISNLTTAFTFTATAPDIIPGATYQWKLNGGNVGTNTNTYTNTALNTNDIVTCVLVPITTLCATYTSNSITKKDVSSAVPSPVVGATICSSNTATISATSPAGAVTDWYAAASGGSVLTGGTGVSSFTTAALSATTIFYAESRNVNTGCVSASRAPVTVTVIPGATVVAPSTICIGANATLSPVSGGTWASSNTAIATVTNAGIVTPVAAGTVTFSYTLSSNGCVSTSSPVTIGGTINANITADYCVGGGVVRLTSTPQSTYLWTNGGTTQSIDVNTAGVYGVTVTNVAGCVATTTINVASELVTNGDFSAGNNGFTTSYNYVAPPSSTALYAEGTYTVTNNANNYHANFYCVQDHTSGSGNFMVVNGSAAGYEIWEQTVTVQPNTTYYFSAWATNMNPGLPAELRFAVNNVQVGTTATLLPGPTSTAGPFVWQQFYGTWNSGSNTTAILNVVDLQTAPGGNDFGLDDISFGTLSPTSLSVTASSNSPVCDGATLNLVTNITGGNAPFTYSWSGPASFSSSAANPAITGVTAAKAGSYSVAVTDRYGCSVVSGTTSVTVSAMPTMSLSSTKISSCFNTSPQTTNLSYSSTTNSPVSYSIVWNAAALSAGLANVTAASLPASPIVLSIPAGLAAATYSGTLTVTNATGCISAGYTFALTINPQPVMTSAATASICTGGTVNLAFTSTPSATYSWVAADNTNVTGESLSTQTSGTLNNSLVHFSSVSQYVVYTVTPSAGGCTGVPQTVTVRVNPPISANSITGAQNICKGVTPFYMGGNTPSGGDGNYTYLWEMSYVRTSGYTAVPGISTNIDYTPTQPIYQTAWVRRRVSSGGCSGVTGLQTVLVDSPVTNNIVASSQAICSGATPNVLVGGVPGGGDFTDYFYYWESSTTSATTGFSEVTGTSNDINYSPGSLTQNTWYRRYVFTGGCTDISPVVQITMKSSGEWIGPSGGDWNVASNWCGGIPTSATYVTIPAGNIVNIQSANAVAHGVNIAAGSSVVMTGPYNLTISQPSPTDSRAGGAFVNNGSFDASASTGTVAFLGNNIVRGTTTFKNLDTYGILDFGPSVTVSGAFSLQSGASVTGNAPFYTCPSATLLYKAGSTFNRGLEWTSVSGGAGLPASVLVQNNTTVNFPAAGDGYVCYDLQIDAGSAIHQDYAGGSGKLTVGRNVTINGTLRLGSTSGGDIALGGNWTRNSGGVFVHNDRKVTFEGSGNFSGNGTAMSTITAPASSLKDNNGGFGGEKFAHIWINKTNATDSVVLLSNITVTKELGFTKGTFSLRNSDVTIASNNDNTADIAPVATTANVNVRYGGTGRFAIQRYVPNPTATRSWRLLTAPLSKNSAPSINEAYMEGAVNPDRQHPNANGGIYNPWPGYGLHITGPSGTYSAVNGFDQGTNSASILYSGGGGWIAPVSTFSVKITDQPGWMLFVRGDRSFVIGNQYVPAQNTTLEPKGKINIGDYTMAVSPGRQVVGNPYASAVSLLNVDVSGTPGKSSNYLMWDPKMFTSYTQPGKFVNFAGLGSSFVKTTSASAYPLNGTIESGQAFILDVNSAGNVVFHESDKLALTNSLVGIENAVQRPMTDPVMPMFRSDIYAKTDTGYTVTDGVLDVFYSGFNNAADYDDSKKYISFNTKESLSILRDSVKIAIEKRAELKQNDTIFFSMTKFNEIQYRFRFDATDMPPMLEAFLEDNFLGIKTPLSTQGISMVDFNITSNPDSKAEKRFKVVFKSTLGAVLPVNFTSIKAVQQGNEVAVQWNVDHEINTAAYVLEKSTDGQHFFALNKVLASGAKSYGSIDNNPRQGENYYRVMSLDKNGDKKYSTVVKVNLEIKADMVIFPNPVVGNTINIQMKSAPEGEYVMTVFDYSGKPLYMRNISHSAASFVESITLSNELPAGSYKVDILQPDGSTTVLTFIK